MDHGKQSGATSGALVDFEAVCKKVRAAVEPARLHAVSLHDENGDILWLTESSMGPDEHNVVREALETFGRPEGPPVLDFDLGDSRSAVLFRTVNARRALVGAVMVVTDTRGGKPGEKVSARLLNPKLQRALFEFAGMRPDNALPGGTRPMHAPTATAEAPLELTLADSMRIRKPAMALRPTSSAPSAPALQPLQRPVATDIDRLNAALRRSPVALHIQRLVPLAKGGELQRYEVLLRSKSAGSPNAAPHDLLKSAVAHGLGSMIDRRVVTELIGWLVTHPDVWQMQQLMFSVNLTSTALRDVHFVKFVEQCLVKSSLKKGMIAFEIDVNTALELPAAVKPLAKSLHRLGCPLVLDDFGLRTECLALLRLPGVRYVKLASSLTARMRSDKISQAAIAGVVQMSRVLGMHTVAKRTETAAEQEWLTALGVDFIQSNALSPPASINGLVTASHRPAP